jgi:hypothetical protein
MRYIWRAGAWRDPETGEEMTHPNRLAMPMIHSDITAYKSPLGDHWIDGRRAQREELKRNDMVINEKKTNFNREEYAERKARQAKLRT